MYIYNKNEKHNIGMWTKPGMIQEKTNKQEVQWRHTM